MPRFNELENIRRRRGVKDKLNDHKYLHTNADIQIRQEAQQEAFRRDEEKIKQEFRKLRTKFKKD